MKSLIFGIFAAIFLNPFFTFASGLETKGIGARARGMGFAMVSQSNDWTAVHYNPASAAMIEGSIFGSEYEYFTGSMDSTKSLRNLSPYSANPWRGDFIDFIGDEPSSFNKDSIDSDIHFGALGYVSSAEQFSYGIGMYGSGSGTAWEDTITSASGDNVDGEVSFINGSLNVPIVFAYKFSPIFAAGVTLGLQWGLLEVTNSKIRTGYVPYTSETIQDTEGVGLGTNLGLIWKAKDNVNFGLVFKFPYTFRKSGTTTTEQTLMGINASSDTTVDMKYPLRIAFGTDWKPSETHLFAFNITWFNWDEFNMKINYDDEIPGIFEDSSSNPSDWEDTYVYNLGYEYKIDEEWKFRSGITYDQAPEPEDARILTGGQVVDAWLFSIGAGKEIGNLTVDFGYIYTYGPEVEGFIPDAKYSMNLHEFFIGLVKKI